MSIRRNIFIRSVVGLTGDFAVGFALGLACIWIIEVAALGLFLSFLLWLIALVAGLAISQYALHATVQFALSDRKLDRGIEVLASLSQALADLGFDFRSSGWSELRHRFDRFTDRYGSK